MYSIGMRGICVIIWVISAFQSAGAWEVGDWRRFIEQIAQALVATVIWFAVPRGAEEFRPLPIGTRSLRLAIYGGVLAVAMIASLPWPWSDSAYGSSAVFMFAAVIFLLVLRAEHESTP